MGCEGLSLKEIAGRSRELVERAKGGKISEAEISGGTFSISNLGMYGVEEFTAVIQPPQGAILAIGAVRDEAVVENGAIAVARIMRVTLSADHRLVDGAYAAGFLQEFKRVLENPVTMLM
jgi:pyruvate dehydrogenase E2 component (dihydrolipoamide acetyltransferase)